MAQEPESWGRDGTKSGIVSFQADFRKNELKNVTSYFEEMKITSLPTHGISVNIVIINIYFWWFFAFSFLTHTPMGEELG